MEGFVLRLRRQPRLIELVKNHPWRIDRVSPGQWREVFPEKSTKLALEIGSGKGGFLAGMSKVYPEMSFIGLEKVPEVVWQACKRLEKENISNVRMLEEDARDLPELFAPGEVDRIYLNFSDPWPKARHSKRRLTYRDFLLQYKTILAPGGHLRFKTDNKDLFDFSVEEFKAFGLQIIALSYDLHNSEYENAVQTEYEEKFSAKGNKINFCEVVF